MLPVQQSGFRNPLLLQKEDKDPPGEQNKAAFPKMVGVAASDSGCQDASQVPKAPIGDRLTQMPSVAPSMPSDGGN